MEILAPVLSEPFSTLRAHYEACFAAYGDCARGVDWPDAHTAKIRYQIMAEFIRTPGSVLDIGCGAGHFLEYLHQQGFDDQTYRGIDISSVYISHCRKKFPSVSFDCLDIMSDPDALPEVDYAVFNGVFTERLSTNYDDMFSAMTQLISHVFTKTRKGLAFNLMSKHIDWERDDLFHVPYDAITQFIVNELSRHHVIRADYRLFEYTVYVYKFDEN